MDRSQRIFYRLHLENAIRRAGGVAFQSLFADVMERKYGGNFVRVRPYGSQGDLKCDGYLSPEKVVYQCYAPRDMRQAQLINKINKDYEGAASHWIGKMNDWHFVHNDFEGLPPEVTQLLEGLRDKQSEIGVKQVPPSELIELALSLPVSKLEDLFGPVPTEGTLASLTFGALQPVVAALARRDPGPEPPVTGPSRHKLRWNELSEAVADFLQLGRRREKLVQEYFARYPEPEFGEQIAEAFRRRYSTLKDVGYHTSDEIFAQLRDYAGWQAGSGPTHQAAVLAVMSYFFERCDIFEDAPEHEVTSR